MSGTPNPRSSDDDSPVQGRNPASALLEALITRATPSCQAVTRQISESLDRPLSWRKRAGLRLHYLVCCYCRRYEDHLHAIRRFGAALPEQFEQLRRDRLSPEAVERLRARLREERGDDGEGRAGPNDDSA